MATAITTDPAPSDITEALILCCALAWKGNALSGLDHHRSYAENIITATRTSHSTHQILHWRADTHPNTWNLNWKWARRLILAHFPNTSGADALPLSHHDALPAATTLPAATP